MHLFNKRNIVSFTFYILILSFFIFSACSTSRVYVANEYNYSARLILRKDKTFTHYIFISQICDDKLAGTWSKSNDTLKLKWNCRDRQKR